MRNAEAAQEVIQGMNSALSAVQTNRAKALSIVYTIMGKPHQYPSPKPTWLRWYWRPRWVPRWLPRPIQYKLARIKGRIRANA